MRQVQQSTDEIPPTKYETIPPRAPHNFTTPLRKPKQQINKTLRYGRRGVNSISCMTVGVRGGMGATYRARQKHEQKLSPPLTHYMPTQPTPQPPPRMRKIPTEVPTNSAAYLERKIPPGFTTNPEKKLRKKQQRTREERKRRIAPPFSSLE